MFLPPFLLIFLSIVLIVDNVTADLDQILSSKIVKQSRRLFNFGSMFGSATTASPYDRVSGHPVFQVTTPFGSPYLNMERLTDMNNDNPNYEKRSTFASMAEYDYDDQPSEYRTVALFFMDPDDALSVHGEMTQMENLQSADIRITSSSLSKALRQSSNLGNGMLTGFPPNPLTGKIKSVKDGGSLRYKIVPPKRQLYYAARCKGKERVGLFADSAAEDARNAIMGNSALNAACLQRRLDKTERKFPRKRTTMALQNSHMDGYYGIPVFYAPEMTRKIPKIKQLLSGVSRETPLFFNYEDLQTAWTTMRNKQRGSKATVIPEKPNDVEVFNLWDVVTSMEREMWIKKEKASLQDTALNAIKSRFISPKDNEPAGLESITFVPSSRSVHYKEGITARGNGKARLRPMR